jgi:hypothetical protein
MPWMETGAGTMELIIGLDNRQRLPAHVEDSWGLDDDMKLMKSAFGHRFMITDGWGWSLLPPGVPPDEQGDAAGGGTEDPGEIREVRLEEYLGWSRGTWTRDKEGAREASTRENQGSHAAGRGGAAARKSSP